MQLDKDALKRKLSYLSAEKKETAPPQNKSLCQSLFSASDNWQQLGDYIYVRREKVALPAIKDLTQIPAGLLLPGTGFGLEDLLFFDTETTGLSGGAGSFIFLLGLGWFSRSTNGYDFECEQVFLDDFPGEPEYIAYLKQKLTADRLYVSYNGKTFDAHLLKSRFLINRQELELPHQLDLLHLTRTFCKRTLAACTLACVERELLHVERREDIPGALVPDVYLNYLRQRRTDELSLVFKHNFQDILSLAQLYILLERVLAGEELPVPLDWSRVGEYLLRQGRTTGVTMLEKKFKQGELYAGQVLSLHYKQLGQWEEALAIWQIMAGKQSLFAKFELAKYFEHRIRDFSRALYWVDALERDYRKYGFKLLSTEDDKSALFKRKQRLLEKLERQTRD